MRRERLPLVLIEWLDAQEHSEVHLAGKGWGALAATFAALLSKNVVQMTLKHALRSFAEVAETEDYRWPYAALLYVLSLIWQRDVKN